MDVWNGRMVVSPGRPITEPEMRRQVEVLRRRADALERVLTKREQKRPERLAEAEKKREAKEAQQQRLRGGPPKFHPTDGEAEPMEF